MARSSVRAIVTAAALWNLLSVGDSIAGEEVIKNFSLSLQNGFYVGADYLQESKLGDVSPQDVPSWASGRIGWQGSVGKFSSDIGLAYSNLSSNTWMDGIINMHTQLSQSITAFSGHDLGLSMRLNVAMPLGDVAESVTSGLLSISDVWKPSETLTVRQHFAFELLDEELHRSSYEFKLDWRPRHNITLELPLTIGVPLGEVSGEPDIAISARFKMQF